MGKQIIGYVISHSGKPGGPWESNRGIGVPAETRADRWVGTRIRAHRWLGPAQKKHHSAKVFRLVRRERHTAEEAAVVEAAMVIGGSFAMSEAEKMGPSFFRQWLACAALRAKRGAK